MQTHFDVQCNGSHERAPTHYRNRRRRVCRTLRCFGAAKGSRTALADRSRQSPSVSALLYQVATSVHSPAQMASPIREIVGKHQNTTVLMAKVVSIDKEEKLVFASSADRERAPLSYDYLILGGTTHSYFGHNDFERAFLRMLQHGRDDLVSGRVRWTDLTPTEWRERDERALTRQWQPGLFSHTRKSFSERWQPLACAGCSRAVSRYERRRRFRA